MINHLWNAKVRRNATPGRVAHVLGWLLTFLCVVLAWIVFRADGVHTAMAIYKGMLGMHGAPLSAFTEFGSVPYQKSQFFQTLLVGMFICLALPPTITLQRWVPQAQAFIAYPRAARACTAAMAVITVVMLGLSVSRLGTYSPFLYFQF